MDNYARGAAFLNLRFNFRYDDFLKYIADDPNERFDDDQTALHLLMYENEPPANLEVDNLARKRVIKQLLDWKADIDAADEGGDTPLYMAVCAQNVPIVKFLLEQGANMRPARDEDDELVLQAYNQETQDKQSGDFPMCRLFMLNGAHLYEFHDHTTEPSDAMRKFYYGILLAKEVATLIVGCSKRSPVLKVVGKHCCILIARIVYQSRAHSAWSQASE
jgi:hypothetical protein